MTPYGEEFPSAPTNPTTAGSFTDAGREARQRIEALTDELAAPAYDVLTTDELDELVAELESIPAAT
jgi:hypothetical protein